MTDQDFSQFLVIGVAGEELSDFERSAFTRYPPGGVILFARNCVDPEKTGTLILELQELSLKASGLPLIIAVDQEGGPVTRLQAGFPQFSGAAALGAENHFEHTREIARALASALFSVGINCNLAPVADLYRAPSRVLHNRCFGSDPQLVAEHVRAFVEGLQNGGVMACVKHFPGHGCVVEDSHKQLPVSDLLRPDLEIHLIPFRAAIDAGVRLMMAAHIKFSAIDSRSVPFSPLFLTDIARIELGFDGVMLSDDLDMGAVADRPLAQVMVAGLKAGLDMALWGRNMRPVADPAPLIADFCRQMTLSFLDIEVLRPKIERVRRLREDIKLQ